jgi:hypothetical protein
MYPGQLRPSACIPEVRPMRAMIPHPFSPEQLAGLSGQAAFSGQFVTGDNARCLKPQGSTFPLFPPQHT